MSQKNQKESDALAIQRCLNGETEAFGELVADYQDRLFNAIVYAFRNREDAEDVVQETFLQAFVKLDTFRNESSFYTWLYRIGFNTAINKKRKKRPTLSVDYAREQIGDEPVDCHNEQPDVAIVRNEEVEQIHEALERLPEQQRAILVLREIENMDYKSISTVLDLPIGTVRSRLSRARGQLKVELEKNEPSEKTEPKNQLPEKTNPSNLNTGLKELQ